MHLVKIPDNNLQQKQHGVGLIEVLVALMIFSMGMLGIASLQVISKRSSFESQQRQEAVMIANDIISRIKNSGLSPADIETNYNDKTVSATVAPAAIAKNCLQGECSVSELVAYDLNHWHRNIYGSASGNVSGLAYAKGCIDVDGDIITVTVAWMSLTAMTNSKTRTGCVIDGNEDKQREVKFTTSILNTYI